MDSAITQTNAGQVRSALLDIANRLPASVHACVFNLVEDPDLDAQVAIVVMILAFDRWTIEADQACAEASDLAWAALNPLGIVADVICRTQAEHEEVRRGETWMSLDDSCE